MLFFVGGFFLLMAFIMLIKFIVFSQRPKLELPVKEFFFAKLKTDMLGIGPSQKHARVSFTVDGKEYNAEVPVMKNNKTQVGENIRVTYKKSNPKSVRLHDPKKELLMIFMMFLMGAIVCGISLVVSAVLESMR